MSSDAEPQPREAAPDPARRRELAAAQAELERGRPQQAEHILLRLLEARPDDPPVLEALVALYLKVGRIDQAEPVLHRLVATAPDVPGYRLELAALLERSGNAAAAEAGYAELIERQPQLAVARFNHACFLKRSGRLEAALSEHQKALDLGIEQPEEVLSNMAVICTELRQDESARAFLQRSLAARPNYIPALYNLGLLHEEFGDRDQAIALFDRILGQDPTYYSALVRIAHTRRVADPADEVVKKLRRALRRTRLDALTRESLHIALGKVLDDCGAYEEAFAQFQQGNRLSSARLRPYDRAAEERRTSQIVATFSADWLARAQPVSERPLVFITGMFRSGSTLFEQVLAAHPRIIAGGEIDYFGPQLARLGVPFPAGLREPDTDLWRKLGTGYQDYLERTFPADRIVTDKRPDTFAYVGLIKGLFPNARFIHTVRNPLDTCLSIYFEQLDEQFTYANDLENIAHYYLQYRRLMTHWKQLLGDSIFDAVYDDFVADPQATTRALLRFLDLEWDERCLEFQKVANRVRTASVAQVREPVYRRSSGRWRNYDRHLEAVRRMLG
jgi:tetratricopeptide (TPR) repeat protein